MQALQQIAQAMSSQPTRPMPARSSSERVLRELNTVRLGHETLAPPLPPVSDAPPPQAQMTQQPVAPASYQRSVQAWAQQIAAVSRRAEAAELRARKLEALLMKEATLKDSLGRRFGQHPKESFEDFVARLATVARVRRTLTGQPDAPVLVDVVHLSQPLSARRA